MQHSCLQFVFRLKFCWGVNNTNAAADWSELIIYCFVLIVCGSDGLPDVLQGRYEHWTLEFLGSDEYIYVWICIFGCTLLKEKSSKRVLLTQYSNTVVTEGNVPGTETGYMARVCGIVG